MTPPGIPSMKARRLRTLLETRLGYSVARQTGSHRTMKSPGRPSLIFAFHDGDTLGPNMIWTILKRDAKLSDSEAWEVIRGA